MIVKLQTEHHLEFLRFKGGCTGSSGSTVVKMPHCWKSHVAAQLCYSSVVIMTPTVFTLMIKLVISLSRNRSSKKELNIFIF